MTWDTLNSAVSCKKILQQLCFYIPVHPPPAARCLCPCLGTDTLMIMVRCCKEHASKSLMQSAAIVKDTQVHAAFLNIISNIVCIHSSFSSPVNTKRKEKIV